MSIPKRIEEITAQVKDLDDRSAELQAEAFKLRTEREELIAQMILEDKMLANTDWELRLSGEANPYLEYRGPIDEGTMDDLFKLARTDWHCWFELTDGIKLQFDDNNVSLTFSEAKQIMPFIKQNKLKVTGTGVSDKLAKLKREVAALEDACHQFNL
jgi:hypothetical protein